MESDGQRLVLDGYKWSFDIYQGFEAARDSTPADEWLALIAQDWSGRPSLIVNADLGRAYKRQ
jgi:hypothetical protein